MTNVENPELYPKTSVSEMLTLARCAKKHDYQYRQGLEQKDPPIYLSKGSYLHALAANFLQFIQTNPGADVPPVSNLSRMALAELEKTRPGVDFNHPDLVKAIREVNALFETYIGNQWSGIVRAGKRPPIPIAIEQEFYADMGLRNDRMVPVLLHGVIDAVLLDPEVNEVWIIDWKTASRAWSKDQFNFDYQIRLYMQAWKTLTGEAPTAGAFRFFTPKKWLSYEIFATDIELDLLVHEAQELVHLRDVHLVTRQPHWGCNDCWYKNLCLTELSGSESDFLRKEKFSVNTQRIHNTLRNQIRDS